jgi:hypothetical protein
MHRASLALHHLDNNLANEQDGLLEMTDSGVICNIAEEYVHMRSRRILCSASRTHHNKKTPLRIHGANASLVAQGDPLGSMLQGLSLLPSQM